MTCTKLSFFAGHSEIVKKLSWFCWTKNYNFNKNISRIFIFLELKQTVLHRWSVFCPRIHWKSKSAQVVRNSVCGSTRCTRFGSTIPLAHPEGSLPEMEVLLNKIHQSQKLPFLKWISRTRALLHTLNQQIIPTVRTYNSHLKCFTNNFRIPVEFMNGCKNLNKFWWLRTHKFIARKVLKAKNKWK